LAAIVRQARIILPVGACQAGVDGDPAERIDGAGDRARGVRQEMKMCEGAARRRRHMAA
jgi:hypothetical protein